MNTLTLIPNTVSRRSLLKAAPFAVVTAAVSAKAEERAASRFTTKIQSYLEAKALARASAKALDAAETAVEEMGAILVPVGLLPNGGSPAGFRDLFVFGEKDIEAAIRSEAEGAKVRLCSAYAEGLAPGRNVDIEAGIDGMLSRSLAALEDAKELRRQREDLHRVGELGRAFWAAEEALDEITTAILALPPETPGEALEKASWLRDLMAERNGYLMVQEWNALIASIGGVRISSVARA
jgi:hypothetical protein